MARGAGWAVLVLLALAPIALAACPFAGVTGSLGDGRRQLLAMGGPAPPPCDVSKLDTANKGRTFSHIPFQSRRANAVKQVAWDVIWSGDRATAVVGVSSKSCPITTALVRAAFHDAGTFNSTTKKGGPNGSLRYELKYAANSDSRMVLASAYIDKWTAAINARIASLAAQQKHYNGVRIPAGTKVSRADVTQLAGAAAITALGGHKRWELFDLVPLGRKDVTKADDISELPAPFFGFGDLACRFLRNGYTLQDVVALSGAHTVGFFELGIEQTGGHSQQWRAMDQTPNSFDTNYFQLVLKSKAAFTSDNTLMTNKQTAAMVREFASSRRAFLNAFARAYLKMASTGAQWAPYP